MPADRDSYWLHDMVDSAQRATYVQGISESQFYADLFVQDAVAWRIAIIGEAARRVSDTTRGRITGLPWKQIVQMCNKLLHEYSHIRADIIWAPVQHDLPALVTQVEAYLNTLPGSGAAP